MNILSWSSPASAPAIYTVRVTGGKGRDWENEKPPTAGEDQVWEHPRNLKNHRT